MVRSSLMDSGTDHVHMASYHVGVQAVPSPDPEKPSQLDSEQYLSMVAFTWTKLSRLWGLAYSCMDLSTLCENAVRFSNWLCHSETQECMFVLFQGQEHHSFIEGSIFKKQRKNPCPPQRTFHKNLLKNTPEKTVALFCFQYRQLFNIKNPKLVLSWVSGGCSVHTLHFQLQVSVFKWESFYSFSL